MLPNGFHRAANSIFGKVGRVASEEVVIQLISSKRMPILLYGLETCALRQIYDHWTLYQTIFNENI